MISSIIISSILTFLWSTITAFWGWIVAGGVALLGVMFSPTLRKYTIAAITVIAILISAYAYGYTKGFKADHPITPPACVEFRKHLVEGPATDKAITIFKRNGLCV